MSDSRPWLDVDLQRRAYADWFLHLAQQEGLIGDQRHESEDRFVLGGSENTHVVAKFEPTLPYLSFHPSGDGIRADVEEIAARAYQRILARDLGGPVWHSVDLREAAWRFDSMAEFSLLLLQVGNQVRIQDWRRLGRHVLLEFDEDIPEGFGQKPELTAPKANVHVHFALPGPQPGFLSWKIAGRLIETVTAICGLALGRPLQLPGAVFPTSSEKIEALSNRYADPTILTLARDSVSLDIFSLGEAAEHPSLFTKLQSSLITFDAATRLSNDSVATILYVVAAEALASPNTSWRHERLTTRFIRFFSELMPEQLDEIVGHSNFESAFRIRKGQRQASSLRRTFLDRLYDLRSGQLHEGVRPSYKALGSGSIEMDQEMRRGLASDFAQQAILRFIDSPRSSLVGHPAISPPEGGA